MVDQCSLQAPKEADTKSIGASLARTLYRRPATVLLRGALGAGKTTFVQGFAAGLGIGEKVTSPTYALEQRYGDTMLSHIDLYRLTREQAAEFLERLDPFSGIRIIEWSDRVTGLTPDIEIDITEEVHGRRIVATFHDLEIPTDEMIAMWMGDVGLPEHIRRHVKKVTEICEMVTDVVVTQGRIVRRKALYAAALSHDLLRFVDFTSMTGDATYTPTALEREKWERHRDLYGRPHEAAAERFLAEHGYPEIGHIVRTHRGHGQNSVPETIEQVILCYADKRAAFDKFVTLDERFDDFLVRYGKGKESADAREWRSALKRMETFLFPSGAPF